jgi:uncharacterized protein (TIGR03435 family)
MMFRGGTLVGVALALLAVCAVLVRAQQSPESKQPLTFEVASVKASPPDERRGIVHQPPGGQSYEAIGVPLSLIMTVAYTVTARQISGGPDWINSDRWTIEAKAERTGTSDELHDALARLIEDRFQLKARHEKREMPCYILTVDKKGAKLPVHDAADLIHDPFGGRFENGELHMTGHNATMNYFAFMLSRGLDRNVIDQTGLAGSYDIDYYYLPELPNGGRGPDGGPAMVNGQPVSLDGPDICSIRICKAS